MLGANEQSGVVTAGPWPARDGFIAETAIKLDRLHAKLERLQQDGELVKHRTAELLGNAQQADRFQAFEESLRNSREYKIDDMLRCVKNVKARLEQIEGSPTSFNGLTYRSFEAIDRKLTELNAFQTRLRVLERNVKLNALFFVGSLFLLGSALVARFM